MKTATPLARRHMPADFSISLAEYTARGTRNEVRIPTDFGPLHDLRGFEETYRNIIDYIVRITYRIWEERDVEYIGQTYSDTSAVFDDYGLQRGSAKIISDTRGTLAAYSDIRLLADEVIWAGNDKIGFHTSHRVIIRGTNDGNSKLGPATNRPVDVMVIANCVALDNEIFLEHVLYNTSAMLPQLGFDSGTIVSRLLDDPPAGWPRDHDTWNALRAAARPAAPISVLEPVNGFDVDRFVRATLSELWEHQNYRVLDSAYAGDFCFDGSTNRRFHGIDEYRRFLQSFANAFTDLSFQVDEVYWMGNDHDGYLVSARWSAEATHSGDGMFGVASNKPVEIWGITQIQIQDERIKREWMLFNELDLLMQIAAT